MPETMGDACPVCCESFNRSTRIARKCPFCEYTCCSSCLQTYLLGTVHEPHCMAPSCRKVFTLEHQETLLSAAFRNGPLKSIKEEILFAREKALLPESQREIEREREEVESRIPDLEFEIEMIRMTIDRRRIEAEMVGLGKSTPRYKELAAKWKEMTDRENELRFARRRMAYRPEGLASGGEGSEKRTFIWPCPAEGCRGFLSSAWKCGTCCLWACPDCLELRGDGSQRDSDHTCDPTKKESAALIRKDSQPCPSCHSLIFKISGCDQMFCTVCHTAFSWRTGQVEKGVIHNPHYYQFRTQQAQANGGVAPRVEGDIPCGGLPSFLELDNYRARLRTTWGSDHAKYRAPREFCWADAPPTTHGRGSAAFPGGAPLWSAHRTLAHVGIAILGSGDGRPWSPNQNRDLRVRYLKQEVETPRFKQLLRHREKKRAKREAYRDIYRMLHDCGAETLRDACVAARPSVTDFENTCRTLHALREYFNEAMERTSKRFNSCVAPFIDPSFILNEHKRRDQPKKDRKGKKPAMDEDDPIEDSDDDTMDVDEPLSAIVKRHRVGPPPVAR